MRNSPAAFLLAWLALCQFCIGAGTWNGVAFTAWNGVAITAWNGTGISVGGGVSYLVNQGFEGTGYDNSETWTEAGTGTIDEDYTTSPIVGSQSLRITLAAQTGSTYAAFTAQDTVYFFARLRFDSITGGASRTLATFRDGSATVHASLQHSTSGVLRVSATGGTANNSTDALPTATDIYVWFEYVKGTGTNAIARAGWSTDGTKPTLSAGAAKACVSNDGTSTAQASRIYLGHSASSTIDTVWDKTLVDDAVIGSNP